MNEEEKISSTVSDRDIRCGERYDHTHHGRVEVTGIWHGTQWTNTVHDTDEREMIVVRYLPPEGEDWSDELSERLNEFLDAID